MKNQVRFILEKAAAVKAHMLEDAALHVQLAGVAELMINCFQNGGKVLFCGNGGSAADAQHIAAELSGRFYLDRDPLFAEALHVNSSFLTAVANDYGFDAAYSRMVKAMGREGDILVGLSTSGRSQNVLNAITEAKKNGMTVVGMTGAGGLSMAAHCDRLLVAPSTDTPRIQEAHITMGHILCELVETAMFGE